ncbi:diguanylate cyclase [Oceanidesulfovibrio indonesiensis]|uniref:Diguanylate cyclase n=1 Tax=Oceanidesulfovibrio indonesiensis TaxID=54767 RepID=A0A7M3MH98_9BACT|nr:tetratricopeptide repeat protein [Oceanidesulfovibrio indonesiensis]TVM18866.1 diguanylate cyclase [Oceanidesulfovibrio indonesiensis]
MNHGSPSTCPAAAQLARHDLVENEVFLRESFATMLSFKSSSLYFPQTIPAGMAPEDGGRALHLPEERKLLAPLIHAGEFLGVFVMRGVRLKAPKTMLDKLPAMAGLVLETLHLRKLTACDPLTGLLNSHNFYAALEREVEAVVCSLKPECGAGRQLNGDNHRAGAGVVSLRLTGMGQIIARFGHVFADRLVAATAEALHAALPETTFASHTAPHEFAVLVPEGGYGACRETAESLHEAVRGVELIHELTDAHVRPAASTGFALFPQDMDGVVLEREPAEQARVLQAKASRAARTAIELDSQDPMPFSRILEQGGRVKRTMSMNRLVISLGQAVGAQEGQRYLVWSAPQDCSKPRYKGEIIVMEVSAEDSLAEIMHQGDPTWAIEPGDQLTLLKDQSRSLDGCNDICGQKDMLTGLYVYRDFLQRIRIAGEPLSEFSIALVRLSAVEDQGSDVFHKHAEQAVSEAASLARELFGAEVLGGRFSMNSLVFFIPERSAEKTLALFRTFHKQLVERHGLDAAVGIAGYPFLACHKADIVENSRKALDFALLLDAPRLGTFGSLALTIAADKLFSNGDFYGALEEYKLALLADESNTLALNSLGVCEARIGRLAEARDRFDTVLARERGNLMARYNLGYVCQKMGELEAAKDAYRRCLKKDPNHLFSLVRLGQVAEAEGKLGLARRYYNRATLLDGGKGVTRRNLARLSYKQNRLEEARELLHEALVHDPKDAFSLHLMARLYLDSGEDPEIAKVLASQSVALRPDKKPYWVELARAFDTLGRPQEAQRSMAHAANL